MLRLPAKLSNGAEGIDLDDAVLAKLAGHLVQDDAVLVTLAGHLAQDDAVLATLAGHLAQASKPMMTREEFALHSRRSLRQIDNYLALGMPCINVDRRISINPKIATQWMADHSSFVTREKKLRAHKQALGRSRRSGRFA